MTNEQVVRVDVPPNPVVGGSVVGLAESLIMNNGEPTALHLDTTEQFRLTCEAAASILKGIEGCRQVVIHCDDRVGNMPASGRFESVRGLSVLRGRLNPRKAIRFRREIVSSLQAKLKARGVDRTVALHANVSNSGHWRASQLTPRQAIRMAKGVHDTLPETNAILVGSDSHAVTEMTLPHGILLARDCDLTPPEQMALIQQAEVFVGMSSGPSIFAVLSDTPYVIIKHREHHEDLMSSSLSERRRLPFASNRQEFVLVDQGFDESLQTILKHLSHVADPKRESRS